MKMYQHIISSVLSSESESHKRETIEKFENLLGRGTPYKVKLVNVGENEVHLEVQQGTLAFHSISILPSANLLKPVKIDVLSFESKASNIAYTDFRQITKMVLHFTQLLLA